MKTLNADQIFPFFFYGEIYDGALAEGHNLYVPVRAIAERLGMDARGQQRRLQNSHTLSQHLARIEMPTAYAGGIRMRQMVCIHVEYVGEWMKEIELDKVAPDIRDEIRRIQEELSLVLRAHMRTSIVPQDILDELNPDLHPAMQEYFNRMHELKTFLLMISKEVHNQTTAIHELEKRVIGLEGARPLETINSAQSLTIRQMIQAIGQIRAKRRDPNPYNGTYGQFYTDFKINHYGELAPEQFEAAVKYLRDWCRMLLPAGELMPSVFSRGNQETLL
jgi:hypothetical protein